MAQTTMNPTVKKTIFTGFDSLRYYLPFSAEITDVIVCHGIPCILMKFDFSIFLKSCNSLLSNFYRSIDYYRLKCIQNIILLSFYSIRIYCLSKSCFSNFTKKIRSFHHCSLNVVTLFCSAISVENIHTSLFKSIRISVDGFCGGFRSRLGCVLLLKCKFFA